MNTKEQETLTLICDLGSDHLVLGVTVTSVISLRWEGGRRGYK